MSIQKVITGNDYNQGRGISHTLKTGVFSTLNSQIMPSAISPDPFIYGNGSPVVINREASIIGFSFPSGSTTSSFNGLTYSNISRFAFGGFYAPEEFNGDTITFNSKNPIDNSPIVKLEKIAQSGWNYFTADELVQISSSIEISLTTNNATTSSNTIYLELKS